MNSQSVELIPIIEHGTIQGRVQPICDARDLHAFLQVRRDFNTWIKQRIAKYGFVEGVDYVCVEGLTISQNLGNQTHIDEVLGTSASSVPRDGEGRGGDRRSIAYHLTLDMAKELAMVQNNERGRQVRRYFIERERIALGLRDNARRPAAEQQPAIDQGLVYSHPLCLILQPQAAVTCVMPDGRLRSFTWRDQKSHHFLVVGTSLALKSILEGHAPIPHYTLFGSPLWFDLLGRQTLMAVNEEGNPTRDDLQPLPAARSLIIGREFETHTLYEEMGYSVARYLVPREPNHGTYELL